MIQTKSQRFANAVLPRVLAVAGDDQGQARKYKTLCKKAGSLVRNSGLMQVLAFFHARAQREHHFKTLIDHLTSELVAGEVIEPDAENQERYLFDYVRTTSVPVYMILTREVLHLLNWHKRFCDTLIDGKQQ